MFQPKGAATARAAITFGLLGVVWVALGMLGIAPAAAATHPTVVSLTFDDGDADQVPAAQAMNAAGLPGTFYVVSGWVGVPGYFTRADLNTLAANGNEIGGHTATHPDLIQIAPTEVSRQICNDRTTLDSWGFRPTSFAYPFSDANTSVEQAAQSCGYNTARGLGDVKSPFSCAGCVKAETSPPPDPYYLRAPDQVDSAWTLADMKKQVTDAVKSSGGWVILTFHHICTPIGAANCQADQSTTPAVFDQFISWLSKYQADQANQTSVRTIDQQVRSYLGVNYPAYSVPKPIPANPPAPVGVNALTNASLEATDPNTGFPQCFQPGGWGTNTVAWSSTTAAHTGTVAEELTLSGYASGDAKLLPTLDLGTCSPTIVPGHSYQLSTWFQSSADSQFALYYRDAAGAWYYWTSGPWMAPSATWQQATFVTPPAPANAVGMSFGLALIASGTLTTDDYALLDTGGAASPATAAEGLKPNDPQAGSNKPRKRLHSHGRPYLPGGAALQPHSRIAPPKLVQSGKG